MQDLKLRDIVFSLKGRITESKNSQATVKAQEEILNILVNWAVGKESNYNPQFDLSKSQVSKILNNKTDFHRLATDINLNLKMDYFKSKIEKQSETNRIAIANYIKRQFNRNDVYPSNVADILSRSFKNVIENAEQLSTSKNSPRLSTTKKNLQIKTEPGWLSNKKSIAHIEKIFSNRFNNDSYKHNLSFLITNQDPLKNDTDSFNIDNEYWQKVSKNFNQTIMLTCHFIYEHTNKNYESPYGPNKSEEFPIWINDCPLYTNIKNNYTIITKNDCSIYANLNHKPLLDENGDVIKTTQTLDELNPVIPNYAYLSEVTSYKEKVINPTTVNVKFVYRILSNLDYEILAKNSTLIGIPLSEFYSENPSYRYINNIDVITRLKQLKALKPNGDVQKLIR